jgi:aerobic C4-dicarboxylate transport protein
LSLYIQVLIAIAAGVALGVADPAWGAAMKPLGDAFIKLIKMIIAPIIFTTVVLGIAGTEDMKKVGRTGGLALLYFEIVSTLALIVGLTVVNLWGPGRGMNIDVAKLDTKAIASYAEPGKMKSTKDFFMDVIPSTFVDAFAKGEILQVLLLALLFGVALQRLGARSHHLFQTIERLSEVLVRRRQASS